MCNVPSVSFETCNKINFYIFKKSYAAIVDFKLTKTTILKLVYCGLHCRDSFDCSIPLYHVPISSKVREIEFHPWRGVLDNIKFANLFQFVVSDIPVRPTSKTDLHHTHAILQENMEWRE